MTETMEMTTESDGRFLSKADTAYWEALYTDGSVLREVDGHAYARIDRSRLASFRIVHAGEVLVEVFVPVGATGRNLFYRRRTMMGVGSGREVWFLFGYAPMGPVFALNVDNGTYTMRDGFEPSGLFAPVVPVEGESDDLLTPA